MSWDLSGYVTVDGHDIEIFDANYTHNVNPMIRAAGWEGFWPRLPLAQPELVTRLALVLDEFDRDPKRFRGMNPDNGWGDFDSLRDLLRRIHDKAVDFPSSKWRFSG